MVDCCWGPGAVGIKFVLSSCWVGKLGTASQSKRKEFSSKYKIKIKNIHSQKLFHKCNVIKNLVITLIQGMETKLELNYNITRIELELN